MEKTKLNCWEFKKCSRQAGGKRVVELGICPTSIDILSDGINGGKNAGRFCWTVYKIIGYEAEGEFKQINCLECDFFEKVKAEEGRSFHFLV